MTKNVVFRRLVIALSLFLTRGVATLATASVAALTTEAAVSAEPPSFAEAARLYVERIKSHPPTGDVDQDFASFLVPQHLSGVELSKVESLYGQDAASRSIAASILAHADRNDPVMTSDIPPLPTEDPRRMTATLLGFLFADQLDVAIRIAERFGTVLVVVAGIPLAGYVCWRGIAILRMMRHLRLHWMSAPMLAQNLSYGERVAVIDLRRFEGDHGFPLTTHLSTREEAAHRLGIELPPEHYSPMREAG